MFDEVRPELQCWFGCEMSLLLVYCNAWSAAGGLVLETVGQVGGGASLGPGLEV